MVVGGAEAVVNTMLYNIIIEAVGIIATVLIFVGMCFKTNTFKSALVLRILNLVGSAIFVIYGALLPAISTAVLNGLLIIVNAVHLALLVKNHKKEVTAKNETDAETEIANEENLTEGTKDN